MQLNINKCYHGSNGNGHHAERPAVHVVSMKERIVSCPSLAFGRGKLAPPLGIQFFQNLQQFLPWEIKSQISNKVKLQVDNVE